MLLDDDGKKELSHYVKKAIGSLTLDEFSAKSGISKYHLSRITNGKFKSLPRESTIIAIANSSESKAVKNILKITYLSEETYKREMKVDEQLNAKSTNNENHFNTDSQHSRTNYNKKPPQRLAGIILDSLLNLPYKWTRILTASPVNVFIDNYFCIELPEKAPFKKWHFLFLEEHPYNYQTYMVSTLGILMNEERSNQEKFSIILDSKTRYMQARMYKKDIKHYNISVILINSNYKILEMYMNLDKDISFSDLKSIRLI